jgi:F-type H+-transporting ATPase subunit gamma
MKGIREIRQRIKSVKNTAQITRAMQLVAASKMKKAQHMALLGRSYSLLMAEIIASVIDQAVHVSHPFMEVRPVKRRGILVIATDKGLCGPLNTNLFRQLLSIEKDAFFVTIGKKATQFLSRSGYNVVAEFHVSDRSNFSEIRVPVEFLIQKYKEGALDTLEVLYTRFINTLSQQAVLQPMLPLVNMEHTLDCLRARLDKNSPLQTQVVDHREMIFEPSAAEIFAALPELFLKQEIYQMVLESKASEHSARMVAMKTATDNAKNLVHDLTLDYNKARQAGITQEILEIAASSLQSA